MKLSIRNPFLIIILAFIIAFSFSSFAFADGYYGGIEGEYINYTNVDTCYVYPYSLQDINRGFPSSEGSVVFAEFSVPAKGKLTLHIEANNYFKGVNVYFYFCRSLFTDDEGNNLAAISPELKYNSKKGVYLYNKTFSIPKGKSMFGLYTESDDHFEYIFRYKPTVKKTSISKLISKKKRQFTVRYKKVSPASGYQIKYSTSSKMKNAKVVNSTKLYKTVKNLKSKKKYYVKVRTYRKLKVNGKIKKYYSKWSKVKTVKTL